MADRKTARRVKQKSSAIRKEGPPPHEDIDLEVEAGLTGKITYLWPLRTLTQFELRPVDGAVPHDKPMELHLEGDYACLNYDAIFSVLLLAMSRNFTVEIHAMTTVVRGVPVKVRGVKITQPLVG